MPGPRARAMELRLIEGTAGKYGVPQIVSPPTDFAAPPAWFTPEAISCFHETVRRLGEINSASEVDTDILISYVMAIQVLRECERAFARTGVTRSKKFKTWEATHRRVLHMQRNLGLTPAARSGMRIKPNEPEPLVKDLFASCCRNPRNRPAIVLIILDCC